MNPPKMLTSKRKKPFFLLSTFFQWFSFSHLFSSPFPKHLTKIPRNGRCGVKWRKAKNKVPRKERRVTPKERPMKLPKVSLSCFRPVWKPLGFFPPLKPLGFFPPGFRPRFFGSFSRVFFLGVLLFPKKKRCWNLQCFFWNLWNFVLMLFCGVVVVGWWDTSFYEKSLKKGEKRWKSDLRHGEIRFIFGVITSNTNRRCWNHGYQLWTQKGMLRHQETANHPSKQHLFPLQDVCWKSHPKICSTFLINIAFGVSLILWGWRPKYQKKTEHFHLKNSSTENLGFPPKKPGISTKYPYVISYKDI